MVNNTCKVADITEHIKSTKPRMGAERSIKIIAELTEDFECVYYVRKTEDAINDVLERFRTSKYLEDHIQGWKEEQNFHNLLDLLANHFVVRKDRSRFLSETRRAVVTEALSKNSAYGVNFNALVEGREVVYQIKFTADREDDGSLSGLVVGIHNIDEPTRREREQRERLKKALDKAKAASDSKTRFLFNMSHDIRTPLNAILGFTDLAMNHLDDPARVQDCLEKTRKSGDILLSLINDILDMSRIESGKVTLSEEKVDFMRIGMEILPMLQSQAAEKDIDFSYEIFDVKDRFVYADLVHTNRILVNLISNAIKYTPRGGRVSVRVTQTGNRRDCGVYRFSVEDNGIGISEEFKKHIFKEFTREKNSTNSGVQGTGLGLSLSLALAHLMNGKIEMQSEQGKGSTFSLIVPYRLQGDDESVNPYEIKTRNFSQLAGKRILIVEDNELNMEITKEILREHQLVTEGAEDGMVAVETIREKGPFYYDCILMDIQMPVMNGLEATREIRKLYPEVHIPIIALSANAFDEDLVKSKEAGMDDHQSKPIVLSQLLQAIARVTEK